MLVELKVNLGEFQEFLSIINKAEYGAFSTFSIVKCEPIYWQGSKNNSGFNLSIEIEEDKLSKIKEYEKKGFLKILGLL